MLSVGKLVILVLCVLPAVGCLPNELELASGGGGAPSGGSIGQGGRGGESSSDAGAGGSNEIEGEILFVSPVGDDDNEGRTPESPLRTVGRALGLARTQGAREIRICAGSYEESGLALDVATSLVGAFDCSTWQRSDAYGFPSFDALNETTIAATGTEPALMIGGPQVANVEIDGFTLLAADDVSGEGFALKVGAGAAPRIRNNRIIGGNSGNGSTIGLGITTDSPADIVGNHIVGGSGTTSAAGCGSIGVWIQLVDGPGPHVHGNRIEGGSGTGVSSDQVRCGSVGLLIQGGTLTQDEARAVQGNSIHGGFGSIEGEPKGHSSIGVIIEAEALVHLLHNIVNGGDGAGSAFGSRAVDASSDDLLLDGNQLYGGNPDLGTPAPPFGRAMGLEITHSETPTITNNLIHSGVSNGADIGLMLSTVSNATLQHNTIWSNDSSIFLEFAIRGTVIENNVILSLVTALDSADCASKGTLRSIRNNAFVSIGVVRDGWAFPNDCTTLSAPLVADIQDGLADRCTPTTAGACADFGGLVATGNYALWTNCPSSSTCVNLTGCEAFTTMRKDIVGCTSALFGEFDGADFGMAALLSTGWQLGPGVPCTVSMSTLNLAIATDLTEVPRTPLPSAGAYEFDGVCTP